MIQTTTNSGLHEFVLPENGFQLSRKPIAWFMRAAARFFSGESIKGDNRVFVLEPSS
jgi:hypothetical protein